MGTCCSKRNTINVKENIKSKQTSKNILEKYSKKSDYKKKYEFISILGNGSFGKVRLYRDRNCPDLKYAIKTVKKDFLDKHNLSSLIQEVKTLSNLDHPNIVKYFETYEDDIYLHIVMEYIPGDNLYKMIISKKQFSEKDMAEIMECLLKAVLFLHHNNVVHRDIKPENILFSISDNYSSLKLIDFGLSASLAESENYRVGSPYYMAPEMLEGGYDFGTDAWSIGVILYVMVTGKYPFYGKSQFEVFEKIKKGVYDLNLLETVGACEDVKDLITKLLIYEPEKRLQINEAIKHTWILKNLSEKNDERTIDDKIIYSITNFAKNNILQKEILFYLAKISTEDEIVKFKKAFMELDKDKSGTIERNEIRNIFEKFGKKIDNVR
jgi:calcium-dependent protein kinase